MKKFLKDTRGVVMMEYIILGCFAVAITVVTVLALGKVYNEGLQTMAWATAGNTPAAVEAAGNAETQLGQDLLKSKSYADALAQNVAGAESAVALDYEVYK